MRICGLKIFFEWIIILFIFYKLFFFRNIVFINYKLFNIVNTVLIIKLKERLEIIKFKLLFLVFL